MAVADFEEWDERNFIKACNNVCYFQTTELDLYFSIVDIGFIFKDYALLALKVKKGLNLFELALTSRLAPGALLPLKQLPEFQKVRRFSAK
jgi:hypothetical protein